MLYTPAPTVEYQLGVKVHGSIVLSLFPSSLPPRCCQMLVTTDYTPTLSQDFLFAVVTGSRRAQVADRDKMPYTYAVLHEVMRIRPLAPMGLPHAVTEDLVLGESFGNLMLDD